MLGFYYGGTNSLAPGRWNDFNDLLTTHFSPFTYVVEFEPQTAAPEPKSLGFMTLALVMSLQRAIAHRNRRKSSREDAFDPQCPKPGRALDITG